VVITLCENVCRAVHHLGRERQRVRLSMAVLLLYAV